MPDAYDASKDPRTGRPIPPHKKAQDQLERAKEEARRLHHEEGIPPAELPAEDTVEGSTGDKPAAMKAPPMKAPPEGWADDEEEEEEELSDRVTTSASEEPLEKSEPQEDVRPKNYQVSIENPAIATRDYELEASGTVCIEEYRGEDLLCRITVDITTEANTNLTIAEANPTLLDAAVDALSDVCKLDREVLHRSLVG
jgi:hypothetical protein